MPKYNPVTTYRLQFNNEFTLKDAKKILPYLKKTGIKTVYSSPLFQAVKGSSHGYDVANPLLLNPEIGTEIDLQSFTETLRQNKMGLILDIVPNHMAFSVENPWIYDVLEKGKHSDFYSFFDILENHPDSTLQNRLMLPFFGKPPEQMIKDKELRINIDKKGFKLNYFDTGYPVSVSAYPSILKAAGKNLTPESVSAILETNAQDKNFNEQRDNLVRDYSLSKETKQYVDECLAAVSSTPEILEELISHSNYLPAFWKATEQKINYRRFFTINGLICVNVQDKNVFNLTNLEKGQQFYSYYNEWIDKTDDYDDVFYRKNRFILYNRFQGELNNLVQECSNIKAFSNLNLDKQKVKLIIGEFLIFCPVYKVYRSPSSFSVHDKKLLSSIFEKVKKNNQASENVVNALEDLFLLRLPESEKDVPDIDTFFRHCMQFTGPLMAKGIEDTAFYSYNPFIGHNEVGDSPGYFGIHTQVFHNYMKERFKKQPLTMNAISTHDTKRGEDARARLNVLSDVPEKWMDVTQKWRKINEPQKHFDGKKEIPSPNDEYLIYQVLVAHLPMNANIDEGFIKRLEEYLVKALREAKVNSSWSAPDEFYENETLSFVRKILAPESKFPKSFLAFMKEILPHGIVNSITQLVLKNTVPGVPDTFQGTETWNLSFVDPDNRRPVDYKRLTKQIDQITERYHSVPDSFISELWKENLNEKIKQFFSWLTLTERLQNEDLFLKGSYIPIKTTGEFNKNIVSFLRCYKNKFLLVVLPLNTASLPENFTWKNTNIELPESAPKKWTDRISKREITAGKNLSVHIVFEDVPFGIFIASKEQLSKNEF